MVEIEILTGDGTTHTEYLEDAVQVQYLYSGVILRFLKDTPEGASYDFNSVHVADYPTLHVIRWKFIQPEKT